MSNASDNSRQQRTALLIGLIRRPLPVSIQPLELFLALFVVLGLAGGLVFGASSRAHAASGHGLSSYLLKITPADTLVEANAPVSVLEERAIIQARDEVQNELTDLQKKGEVGSFAYDANQQAFQVQLTDVARQSLAVNHLVAQISPVPSTNASPALNVRPQTANSQVSSVDYIQVYTPFMWGKVTYGGLSVTPTLYANDKTTVLGIATQGTSPNSVKIDTKSLYFETVFVDPNSPSHPCVMISPGDWVNVVTTGVNPNTGLTETDNRWIPVDDVQAWTSYQNDSVSGHVTAASPNMISQVVVSVTSPLSLANYLTNSTVPYATVTPDPSGNFSFSVNSFVTGANQPKTVDLQQSSTGFVRVVHSDNSEVYTVHGQNTLVLENSYLAHGYAFPLPSAPLGLDAGVAVFPRPLPTVTITLRDWQGTLKDSKTFAAPAIQPYSVQFGQMINGGDTVTVQINNLTLPTITTSPLVGTVDLANNQIRGTGPSNTLVTIGAGHIDGYIKNYSTSGFILKQVTTDGGGNFASGAIQCGTSNQLSLQPGSFGYVGYEDSHGNFIYEDYAAPTNHVLVNYAFVEGWVADGTVAPTVTVADGNGNVKSTSSGVTPLNIWLTNSKLYINTYYHVVPTAFVNPGDTVTVYGGGRQDRITVDQLAAYVNTDDDTVYGSAPAGSTVKVIPDISRTSYEQATADGSGNFAASNPFSTFNATNCSSGTSTQSFNPGTAVGRAYLTHPDGNAVFTVWGQSMHVNENENIVEFYLYPTENLDWSDTPAWSIQTPDPITVTETPDSGSPVSVNQTVAGVNGYIKVSIVDGSNQKAIIRAGDTLSASFTEGSPGGTTRSATLNLSNIPLVVGIPDVDANTVGGLGASSWSGQAILSSSVTANPINIAARSSPAFGPSSFLNYSKQVVDLIIGNSGTVSFSDRQGHRVWSAWAATAFPVKITGILVSGQTVVCGKATPNLGVTIFDASNQPTLVSLGRSIADGSGSFCTRISPPLYRGEAVMAQDDNGTYSQPVIVGYAVYLPFAEH